jgi:hypothetical protein
MVISYRHQMKAKYTRRFRSVAMLLFYILQKLVITVIYVRNIQIHLPQKISGHYA